MGILPSDRNYDGQLKIRKGEGLSQAIASELGLNDDQCKQLGSVWNKILKIAEDKNNLSADSNKFTGKDQNGRWQIFQPGEIYNFTKTAWNQIVDLVNNKLQTSIKKLDGNDPTPPAGGNPAGGGNPVTKPEKPNTAGITPYYEVKKLNIVETNGNKTKQIWDSGNNPHRHLRDVITNGDGTITVIEYGNPSTEVLQKTILNSDGKVTQYDQVVDKQNGSGPLFIYDKDGNLTGVNEYENGKIVKFTNYNPDGAVKFYAKREYNQDGSYKNIGHNNSSNYDFEGEYDANGNKIKETQWFAGGTWGVMDQFQDYNGQRIHYWKKYDTENKLIEEGWYDKDGKKVDAPPMERIEVEGEAITGNSGNLVTVPETITNTDNELQNRINSANGLLFSAIESKLSAEETFNVDGHGVFLNISKTVKIDDNQNIKITYHKSGIAHVDINNNGTKTYYDIKNDGTVQCRVEAHAFDLTSEEANAVISQIRRLFGEEQAIGKFLYKAVKGSGSYGATDQLNLITADNVVSVIEDFNQLGMESDKENITRFLHGEWGLSYENAATPAKLLLQKANNLNLQNISEYTNLDNAIQAYLRTPHTDVHNKSVAVDNCMIALIQKIKEAESAQ